jgi:hypothetical protein
MYGLFDNLCSFVNTSPPVKAHPPVTFPAPTAPNYHKDDGLGH